MVFLLYHALLPQRQWVVARGLLDAEKEDVEGIEERKDVKKENKKRYNITMIVDRDEVNNVEQEVKELKRLLNEARIRRRYIYKRRKQQSWWDWMLEQLGY